VRFFEERSAGLAVGIASSGGGCGMIFMPLIIEKLIEIYSWRGALLFLGGLNLQCCVCGALLRSPPNGRAHEGKQRIADLKILKHASFMMFAMSQIVFSIGYCAVFVHIAATVVSLTGIDRKYSAILISVIGISNFFGRIIQGVLATKINAVYQYCFSYVVTGAALFIFPNVGSYPVLIVLAAIFGFCTAPFVTLSQLIMAKMVGTENLKFAWSIFNFLSGVGFIIGGPIAGHLYDVTGDYGNTMYFSGATILGHLLFLIKPCIASRKDTYSYVL
jgi:predicted MFS family arabinose efflux permease